MVCRASLTYFGLVPIFEPVPSGGTAFPSVPKKGIANLMHGFCRPPNEMQVYCIKNFPSTFLPSASELLPLRLASTKFPFANLV